jgi:hypothetical protein
LINEPFTYQVFQGEFSDVLANHRLKCRWTLETKNVRLSDSGVQQSFYTASRFEHVSGGTIATLVSPISELPDAAYSYLGAVARDSWSGSEGTERRSYQLDTTVMRETTEQNPLLTQTDFLKVLRVIYTTPQPSSLDSQGRTVYTTTDVVRVTPPPRITPASIPKTRTYSTPAGVTVETSFFWPSLSNAPVAGYTAPLVDWVETRIIGLTTEPILLHGYYSQTYRPDHHNFSESFVFEPRLEAGIPSSILAELSAKNIQLVHFKWRGSNSTMTVLGFEGTFRPLP